MSGGKLLNRVKQVALQVFHDLIQRVKAVIASVVKQFRGIMHLSVSRRDCFATLAMTQHRLKGG